MTTFLIIINYFTVGISKGAGVLGSNMLIAGIKSLKSHLVARSVSQQNKCQVLNFRFKGIPSGKCFTAFASCETTSRTAQH